MREGGLFAGHYGISFEVMTLLHLVEPLARSYQVSNFSFRYLSGQLDTCEVIGYLSP